jgi:hypothetical protein
MKGVGSVFRVVLSVVLGMTLLATSGGVLARSDPTRPDNLTSVASTKTSLPRLGSVLVGADRRLAFINGKLLAEGESYRGVTLLEVTRSDAKVRTSGGRELRLRMSQRPRGGNDAR